MSLGFKFCFCVVGGMELRASFFIEVRRFVAVLWWCYYSMELVVEGDVWWDYDWIMEAANKGASHE